MSNEDIIDNRCIHFVDEIKKFLKYTKNAKFATGYFYINGFDLVKKDLQDIETLHILMGNETTRATRDEVSRGYEERQDKKSIIQQISEDIEKADEQQIEKIKELHDLIREKVVDVKVYVKDRFHSKLYIFSRPGAENPKVAVIGSSNFTKPGIMGNTELNLVEKSSFIVEGLEEWFDERWLEAEEFREDLIRIIEESNQYKQFLKKTAPYAYVPPLDFFKIMIKLFGKEYLLEKDNILMPFQELDYKLSKNIIHNFGGVIIANSVGLGKSFIASKILEDYHKEGKKILLLIPPNLREQWEGYLRLFKVRLAPKDILSMYEVSQSDFDEEKYKDYDVIVVDESHNFRNPDSNRFKNFMKKIKNNKAVYILLTATPINNSLNDLKTQIDMFRDENKFRNEDLFKYYNSLREYVKKEDERLKEDIKTLRRKLIVRTTRRDLKRLWREIIIPGKGKARLHEPTLRPTQYSLTGDTYKKIYAGVVDFLYDLELPHLKVLNPDAGKYLVGLYKILLYKRLESSIYAFYQSLIYLKNKEVSFRKLLDQYPLERIRELEKKDLEKKIRRVYEEDPYLQTYLDTGDAKLKEKESKEQYIKDIDSDLKRIQEFIDLVEELKLGHMRFNDDKIEALKNLIGGNKDKKILLFTQFIDTAEYLYDNFKDSSTDRFLIKKVTGDTEDKIAEVLRFNPDEAETIGRSVEPPYTKFLISTDALSEGVNLQPADFVINYDLPWNPVRLIQRIGRAHRIDSKKDIYVYNFIPSKDIDKEMKLIQTLKKKIDNIIEIIGAEYSVLTIDELEKIRKKEVEDVSLLEDKRKKIQDLELDALESEEERSMLSELDRYLLEVIKIHRITKKDLRETTPPKKVVFTTLDSSEKGKLYLFSIDDGETTVMDYKFQTDRRIFKDEFIPVVTSFTANKKHLADDDLLDIDYFENEELRKIEQERKKSQHLVFDERMEVLKKKIVGELNQFIHNRLSANRDKKFKAELKEIVPVLDKKAIPEVYYKELHEFYILWIKDRKYSKSQNPFLKEFRGLLSTLEPVSKDAIKAADIKAGLKGFIVYV